MFLGHASPWLSLLSWGGRGMKKDYKQHPTAFQTVVIGEFYFSHIYCELAPGVASFQRADFRGE